MKDGFVKVAAATPNIKVCDTAYNAKQVIELMKVAGENGVKLLVFPELCLTGSTCGDLYLQGVLLDGAKKGLKAVMEASEGIKMLTFVGLPFAYRGKVYDTAAAIYDGRVLGIVPKCVLSKAQKRYFASGDALEQNTMVEFDGGMVDLGVDQLFCCEEMSEFTVACEIGEDVWAADAPGVMHTKAGATVMAHLSATNEEVGRANYRKNLIMMQSAKTFSGYVSAEAGDGESTTDLVFGGQRIIAECGQILAESSLFSGGLLCSEMDVQSILYDRRKSDLFEEAADDGYLWQMFTMPLTDTRLSRTFAANPFVPQAESERTERCEAVLAMQSAGLQKRILHTYAKTVVVGISGGLDSCLALLVMAHAMDALGRDRKDIIAITMPCFGTTARTKGNAEMMCEYLGVTLKTIDIKESVKQHFADIGHDYDNHNVVFENAQARERTQILMDVANQYNGFVVGTGDLSELALGWATYNGDHMSMYAVNASVPKTMIRYVVKYYADTYGDEALSKVLYDILDTPVSPELLPAKDGEIAQITEDLVGPYELHDFYLYGLLRKGYAPEKIKRLAEYVHGETYGKDTIHHWLATFMRRFFNQQFKRSCMADGPKVGSVTLSPRGDLSMPSDAVSTLWGERV